MHTYINNWPGRETPPPQLSHSALLSLHSSLGSKERKESSWLPDRPHTARSCHWRTGLQAALSLLLCLESRNPRAAPAIWGSSLAALSPLGSSSGIWGLGKSSEVSLFSCCHGGKPVSELTDRVPC